MAEKIYGLNISKILFDAVQSAGGWPSANLLKKTVGAIDPADRTAGRSTSYSSVPCSAIQLSYADVFGNDNTQRRGDRLIRILGKSLPAGTVPEPGDRIESEGSTFEIVQGGVARDPAGATYTCEVTD